MMHKYVLILLVVLAVVSLASCGRREQSLEEMQAPMSIETMATTETKAAPEATMVQSPLAPQGEKETNVAPSVTTAKPTTKEIQAALKNAGFYVGLVDGKRGPLTKKAVEDFQRGNNLEVDGKVGPKTWAVLSKYLNTVAVEPKKKRR